MLFCSKCGTELAEESMRCPVCGKAMEKYPLYTKLFRAKRTVYPVLAGRA